MHTILNILSKTLSIVCYPLFIPSYGMALYMWAMLHRTPTLPNIYVWLNIIGTFVLTALIPIVLIIILWRQGRVSSLHITNPKERTIPYLYSTACFGFWCYFVSNTTHLPKVWLFIALGATVALLTVTIINRWWKISAHLTSIGGLLGGLISMGLYYNIVPTSLVIALLVLSLLLMYARLYLDAHTPMQVVCGYLLGILCTFIPNWIVYHA